MSSPSRPEPVAEEGLGHEAFLAEAALQSNSGITVEDWITESRLQAANPRERHLPAQTYSVLGEMLPTKTI
ncbi:hypothetical protein J6590_031922, partial [Homalodisca vitripennis]